MSPRDTARFRDGPEINPLYVNSPECWQGAAKQTKSSRSGQDTRKPQINDPRKGLPQVCLSPAAKRPGQGLTMHPGSGQVSSCPGHLLPLACSVGTVMGERGHVLVSPPQRNLCLLLWDAKETKPRRAPQENDFLTFSYVWKYLFCLGHL